MLNRIVWEDANPVKNNGKMKLEKEIYADRFLDKNRAESIRIRQEVNIFREKATYL
jgi:hypothetical protein